MSGPSMLEALGHDAPIGLAFLDADLRFVWVNDYLAALTGTPADEHAGCTLRAIWPGVADILEPVFRRTLDTGESIQGVEVVDHSLSAPGYERYYSIDCYPAPAGPDTPAVAGIIVTEITGRRQAQEFRLELAASIVENSDDAIIGATNGRIVSWNGAAERMFGYGVLEAQTLPMSILIPPERSGEWSGVLETIERGERIDHFATVRLRKDGTRADVSISVSPLKDAAGNLMGTSTMARDITRQKQPEIERQTLFTENGQILAREPQGEMATRISDDRARFEAVLRQLPVGVVIVDATSGEIILTNKRMEQIWRRRFRSVAEMQSLQQQFHSDGKPYEANEWPLVRCFNGRAPVMNEEIEVRHDDGSRSTILVSADAVRDANGKMIAVAGVYEDYTQRRGMEEQFRQAQKMEAVGRLAGGVAHDFNNLLTVIIGYGQMMLEGQRSAGSVREDLKTILDSANRASDLTNQLLAFSRRQVVQPKILNLNAVVGGTQKMLRRLIGEDILLETRLAPDIGEIKADAGQIEQILMNLVVNARDALPDGGKVTIETDSVELTEEYGRTHVGVLAGSYIMLAVSDNGQGMDAETKRRIFEPFFTTKELGKGTGLGLSTVYGIVKQCGGDIWVYSEPDKGTTFKIYLPKERDLSQAPDQQATEALPTGSETILLVEDEPILRAMVRAMLQRRGYTVVETGSVYEALELHEQVAPDLLITDVIMPHMSGRALAERLASLRSELKILYMSGYTDDVVLRHGVLSPGVHYLQKPFSSSALARKVREALDTPPPDGAR